VLGPDEALYGSSWQGELVRIDPEGNLSTRGLAGYPIANLLFGRDGSAYGIVALPCGECGPILELVKLSPDGVLTVLSSDYYGAWVPSFVDRAGAVYVQNQSYHYDPAYGYRYGTALARITATDEIAIVVPFVEGNATLQPSPDGFIYGVTDAGQGRVFRIDDAGEPTTLHEFSGPDGAYPMLLLVAGSDGAMYGVTRHGGRADGGTVFRIDPSSGFQSLYSFDWSESGAEPTSLMRARDGALYGTGSDLFFRVDPGGAVTPFHAGGYSAKGTLVEGSDCALYGVTDSWPTNSIHRIYEPGQLCQRVELDPLPDRTFGDAPFRVSARSSSGLPVALAAAQPPDRRRRVDTDRWRTVHRDRLAGR
jgi:uncharacterized repeat protein (TIGR03803 family)